jgi:hypothetical protein
VDRHAKRHQAPGDEKFREHRRSGEIAWLLAGDGCGSQFPHALAIVADPAVGGEFAHPRGVEDRLAGAGVRVAPSPFSAMLASFSKRTACSWSAFGRRLWWTSVTVRPWAARSNEARFVAFIVW